MPYRELMKLPKKEDVDRVLKELQGPAKVEIVGTTFGNKLQVKINTKLLIANIFLFYLCVIHTLKYLLP